MPRRKRLDTTLEWKALKAHAAQLKGASLREMFAAEPARAQAFSLEVGGWYLDYSKNLATAETMLTPPTLYAVGESGAPQSVQSLPATGKLGTVIAREDVATAVPGAQAAACR